MTETVITVRDLGKRYVLGDRDPYGSLREQIGRSVRDIFSVPGLRSPRTDASSLWALQGVSFDVGRGEVIGVVGRNGAGKSTLLRILARVTEPTTGYAEIVGRVATLLEVGTGFHPELTGRDNIYVSGAILGMHRSEIHTKLEEIAAFAEVEKFLDTPVKRYSTGMYMRLAFSVAAHLDTDILFVDEVLAVGDAAFQRKCLGKMRAVAEQGKTVLFVSHDMAAVERLCGRALLLSEGRGTEFPDVRGAIGAYLGRQAVSEVVLESSALRSVSVRQVADTLVIRGAYRVAEPLPLPCLGFVIADELGNPICASNPRLHPPEREPTPAQEGIVEARLTQPKLLNGRYRLSVWFGDGRTDWVTLRDCLSFEVVNMASLHQRPDWELGRVFPQCQWTFSSGERPILAADG